VIRAVHADALLDPATGETARDAVVVIDDGHVTHAGKRATTQTPRDAETIDASGLTVLPGLIDCHVHLTSLGEGLDFARELTTPPTLELMRAVRAARRTLEAGFTGRAHRLAFHVRSRPRHPAAGPALHGGRRRRGDAAPCA
jgi:imidazolonepropionase-like amidohydrolase